MTYRIFGIVGSLCKDSTFIEQVYNACIQCCLNNAEIIYQILCDKGEGRDPPSSVSFSYPLIYLHVDETGEFCLVPVSCCERVCVIVSLNVCVQCVGIHSREGSL